MVPEFYQIRLLFAFVLGYENKGEIAHTFGMNKYVQSERAKALGSSTMRYLSSSAHGTVPILRAGGETYLWMPATSGGENVWRHVLTNGTSPAVQERESL
jgi:hypothetical protein